MRTRRGRPRERKDRNEIVQPSGHGQGSVEPSITELLRDSIAIVLMRADGLTSRDVEAVICNTRQRRTMRQDHAAEPKRLHPAI
jgi:hypothetical protein